MRVRETEECEQLQRVLASIELVQASAILNLTEGDVDFLKSEKLSIIIFFFSSRRRHTRFDCDWSSDVCSSDLRIIRELASYPSDAGPSVVALGAFDGIHLGHRAILGEAVARGKARDALVVACTFDRHPMEVLQPERAPLPITTPAERLELIADTGVDVTLVLAFTPELAAIEPEAFVGEVVVGRLHAQEVIVGFNHTFGRGARGDAALLRTIGAPLGLVTHVVPPL